MLTKVIWGILSVFLISFSTSAGELPKASDSQQPSILISQAAPVATKKTRRHILRLSPDTKVVKTGRNKGRFVSARMGLQTGTYYCGCRVGGNGGTCSLSKGPSTLACHKGSADTCSTSCDMVTTSVSRSGVAAPFTSEIAR